MISHQVHSQVSCECCGLSFPHHMMRHDVMHEKSRWRLCVGCDDTWSDVEKTYNRRCRDAALWKAVLRVHDAR